jgi:hypothetical protein
MSQSVNVPGVGTLQFPDGMSQADMAAAIQKNFPHIHADANKTRLSPAALAAKMKADYAQASTPEARAKAYQHYMDQQVAGMSTAQRLAAGAGKAVEDTGRGLGQIVGLVTPEDVARARTQDAALMRTGAGVTGNVLGYVGEAIPAGLAAGGATAGAAAGLGARLLTGGLSGGAQGYAAPYASPGEHVANTLVGAGLGAALPGAGAAAGNVMKGLASADARALIEGGVRLTPGQLLGGAAKTVEDKLTSVPVVGGAIRRAQQRALDDFNRASVQKALEPIGEKLSKTAAAGYEAIQDGREAISKAYDRVLGQMSGRVDSQLTNGIARTLGNHINTLPDNLARKLMQTTDEDVLQKLGKGQLVDGKAVKEIISSLGNEIRAASASQDPAYRQLGKAYQAVQNDVKAMLKRNNSKALGEQLADADAAHARMLRVENAAARVGAQEGKFTPAQLRSATRAEDASYKKRGFSQGKALLQDWADAGQAALPSKVPDSGTAGRLMMDAGLLGGGAATGHLPAVLAAGALAHATYSRPGQWLIERALAPRPNPVSNYLAQLAQQRLGQPANALAARAFAPQPMPQVPQQ